MPRANALSVDVEDYYQVSAFAGVIPRDQWDRWPDRVVASTTRVLDLFEAARVHGTFFILGCVAERHPALVRDIAARGHEIASHGMAHWRVFEQTPAAFRDDVVRSKRLLEDIAGAPVLGYRAASFSILRDTWWAFAELAEAGYRYSSSVNPIRHDHYGVPDAPRFPFVAHPGLVEIPVATVELAERRMPCGGGGFFRLLPYRWSRWAIGRVNARDRAPAVFYFHPWEIDPGQPRVRTAPLRSRLRHTVNLKTMKRKLAWLLDDFRWAPLRDVFSEAIGRGLP